MVCPQCHAEYRPGFTQCSDCEIKLVDELPTTALLTPELPREPGDPDEDPFVSFWRGDDPRIHAELCELLAENRIPYRSLRSQERLFAFSSRVAFAIGIPFSKFDQAEALIQEAYAAGPAEPRPESTLLLARRPSPPVPESGLLGYTESGSAAAADTWEDAMATPSEMQGSFVTLWAGEDPILHTSLLEELRHAEIPFIDKPIGRDSVAPSSDPLPIDWKARFGFEVAVSSVHIAAAEEILDKLLAQEPVDMELPAEDDAPPPAAPPQPSHLSKATSAVWSGDDSERAGFLCEALKENEIPVRVETQANESTLFVPPEEETLAREIIREILEGAPPA
jgi:hypothetical protein